MVVYRKESRCVPGLGVGRLFLEGGDQVRALAIVGAAEDVEQSAPEGSGISPVALWGSFRHFFFSPLQRFFCSFVVAVASELDRFLRNSPHFVQHRFQSQGIFLFRQDSFRLKERFSRLFRRFRSSWKESSVACTSSINAWGFKTEPPSEATVVCSA